jgi:hypothetical protein
MLAAALAAWPAMGRAKYADGTPDVDDLPYVELPPLKPDHQLDEADLPPVSLPLFDLFTALHSWGRGRLVQPTPATVLAFPALSQGFSQLDRWQYSLAQCFSLYLNATYGQHQADGPRIVEAVAVLAQHTRELVERADELTPGWRPASLDFALLDRRAEYAGETFRYDGLELEAIDVLQWGRSWKVLQSLGFILFHFSKEADAIADDMAAITR